MTDESDKPAEQTLQRLRAFTYATHHPDHLFVAMVSGPMVKRVDVLVQTEDTAPLAGGAAPVIMDEARLVLRPDIALGLARGVVKALNLMIKEDAEHAARFGVTREKLDRIGHSIFQSEANE